MGVGGEEEGRGRKGVGGEGNAMPTQGKVENF